MRFPTVGDWLAWQETLHPQAIDLGLDRISRVWRRMDLDLTGIRVITVAGTNGKGSCVALLEAILLAAGYHVGAYTSPHILRYNERIRIDARQVSDSDLCQAFDRVDRSRNEDSLSYFEFGTLAALALFAADKPDVMILEVGLGGRLDAVNIIDADVALISSIAIDHSDWLGSDREQIGREKAGIFRAGKPAVCADPEPPSSLAAEAQRLGASFHCLGQTFMAMPAADADARHWHWRGNTVTGQSVAIDGLPLPSLRGDVQRDNAAGVIQALMLLADHLPVSQQDISSGLQNVRLPGRYQLLYCCPPGLRQCPLETPGAVPVIADVAHNPAAAQVLARTLIADGCDGRTHAVIGLLADKDIASVVAELVPVIDNWYVVALPVQRASPTAVIVNALTEAGVPAEQVALCLDPAAGVERALRDAVGGQDRVVVTGSFYSVSGFLSALQ